MKKISVILIFLLLLIPTHQLFALSLQDAKSQGLVGETPSGYLEAVSAPSGAVSGLISTVNAKRKKVYAGIAKKNGTPLNQVEKLAGKKAMNKTAAGQYVKSGGAWKKK